jgi:hypothetical protein
MASPLAIIIRPIAPAATAAGRGHESHDALAADLHAAFSAQTPETNILHYVWVTTLPQLPGILVNTVYDFDFPTYIKNLLRASPDKFDGIFKSIEGGAQYTPVLQHLDGAVNFIASLDLNNAQTYDPAPGGPIGKNKWGGTVSRFFQAYTLTVVQIQNA